MSKTQGISHGGSEGGVGMDAHTFFVRILAACAIFAVVTGPLAGAALFSKRDYLSRSSAPWWVNIGMLGAIISVAGLIGAIPALLIEAVVNHGAEIVASAWLAPSLVVAGLLLFLLKKKALLLYGLIELSAAVSVILFVSLTEQGTIGQRLASAATATYFLIRGMDNLSNSSIFKKKAKVGEYAQSRPSA
jgi:hypothetical protein